MTRRVRVAAGGETLHLRSEEEETPPSPGGEKRMEWDVRRQDGKTFEKGQALRFACMNCVALSLQRVSGSGRWCFSNSFILFFILFFWMCYRSRAIGLCSSAHIHTLLLTHTLTHTHAHTHLITLKTLPAHRLYALWKKFLYLLFVCINQSTKNTKETKMLNYFFMLCRLNSCKNLIIITSVKYDCFFCFVIFFLLWK